MSNKAKVKAKVTAFFKYLISLPSVNIDTLEPDRRDCAICLEPYNDTPWSHGSIETVNCPVRLACGHIFGFQCLAEWAFRPNFNNVCLYCNVPLITKRYLHQDATSRSINDTWELRQRFKVPFKSDQETESFQKQMADKGGLSAAWMAIPKSRDRMMVLLDEYFKIRGTSQLAPLTWYELEWWSPERNRFTLALTPVILLLLIVLLASLILIMVAIIIVALTFLYILCWDMPKPVEATQAI